MSPLGLLLVAIGAGVAGWVIARLVVEAAALAGLIWSEKAEAKAHRDETATVRFGADVHRRRSR